MSLQSELEFENNHRKIDIYEYLTNDELEQVTNIFLEALAREEGITPEVFELETNILVEQTYFNDNVTETNKNEEYNKLSEIVPERDAKAVENNTSKVIITPDNLTSQSDNEASEIDTLIDNDSFVEHTSECS